MPFATASERTKKVDRKRHPNDGDRQIDRPFQLGVLLARAHTQRERNHCRDDDRLPTPEVKPAECITENARLAEPLSAVVHGDENGIGGERKNRGVRVQRSQSPESLKRGQIQFGHRQLQCHDQTHQQRDNAPQHGSEQERAGNRVVVDE